jgi:hypothetical protein
MTEHQQRALKLLVDYKLHGGLTCSQLGLKLFADSRKYKPTYLNRAREGGAVLHQLREMGFATSERCYDRIHTVWFPTEQGEQKVKSI